MTLTKEERIRMMEVFIQRHTIKEIAEFMVNLQDSVDGLSQNVHAYVEAYRKELMKNGVTE